MPANEQDLLECFQALGIKTTTHRHPPLHSVAESQHLRGVIPGGHCKSLFLKDKKGQYLLVILSEDQRLDMAGLFKSGRLPVKRLSFASADGMVDMLGVTPGSVTPFCLINIDQTMVQSKKILVVLDRQMMEYDLLNYHPLHNKATVTIGSRDLIKFITHFGFDPMVMDFDNL